MTTDQGCQEKNQLNCESFCHPGYVAVENPVIKTTSCSLPITEITDEIKTEFLLAGRNGDISVLNEILDDFSITYLKSVTMDSEKLNVLHLSARYGTLQVTKYLIELGCDMFDDSNQIFSTKTRRNAFLLSAESGKTDQMKYFIGQKPEILKTVDSRNNNALHISAARGTLEGTEFLVKKYGLDIFDNSNIRGRNAFLTSAGAMNKTDQMRFFIKQNPEILLSTDKYKHNALHLSAKYGDIEGTKFLVEEQGRDILDSSNGLGRNAFLLTAEGGAYKGQNKIIQMDYRVILQKMSLNWPEMIQNELF